MFETYTYRIIHLYLRLLLVIPLMLCISCIDDYEPEIKNYNHLMVVDGIITNDTTPAFVKLSLSSNVSNPVFLPYCDCEVVIIDNSGELFQLQEVSDGIYKSSGKQIIGVVGDLYMIRINTPDGKQYESDYQKIIQPAQIDSIYSRIEQHIDLTTGYLYHGCQFYINTKNAPGNSTNYLWLLEQTYEYNSDFTIKYWYDHGQHPFAPTDSLYTCWLTEKVNDLFVFNTSQLSNPNLESFPLNYVTTETRELSIRYSLYVSQLTISDEAYRFWQDIYDQNAGEASLYTQQLFQIRGNIKNINDPDEPVLGYFMAAGADRKRIFVNRPTENIPFNYHVCVITEAERDAYKYIWFTDPNTWPLYICMDENYALALPQQICIDCRKRGGTIKKPEFWIDD